MGWTGNSTANWEMGWEMGYFKTILGMGWEMGRVKMGEHCLEHDVNSPSSTKNINKTGLVKRWK